MKQIGIKIDKRYELFDEDEILEYPDDVVEEYDDEDFSDDVVGEEEELEEALKKKTIVRSGKKMKVKRSTKAGYTVRDGKEVRMSPAERRRRKKAQKKAAKKRKAKKSTMMRKRKISMKKRKNVRENNLIKKDGRLFIQEAGGSEAGKLEIHKTSLEDARAYGEAMAKKYGRDFDKELPNFDKNYILLQSLVKKGWTKRKDMPVIEPRDVKELQRRLEKGQIDVKAPYVSAKVQKNPFPEGLKGKKAEAFLKRGIKDGSKNDDIIKIKSLSVAVQDLKPIQKQVYLEKSLKNIMEFGAEGTAKFLVKGNTIASNDNYIIDGHHRFAQALMIDPSIKLGVFQIDMPIEELLKFSLAYGDAIGNKRNK